MTVYIQIQGQLHPLEPRGFSTEEDLQRLITHHPEVLASALTEGESPETPRWLLISREMGIPAKREGAAVWNVDHLFVDRQGVPILVEVKRSTDTRLRREVVGQMLEYAAHAVMYWPIDTLRTQFEAWYMQQNQNPDQVLRTFLGMSEGEDTDTDPVEDFWERVGTNLQAGRIRMVFVADKIPPPLRRIVEFLNQQMDPAEVLAVEIRRYVQANMQVLVPRVIGRGGSAERRKGRPFQRRWDETSFFETLAHSKGQWAVDVVREILSWAKRRMPDIRWGTGLVHGSFAPGVHHQGKVHRLIDVYTYGKVEILFQYMRQNSPPFDRKEARLELLRRLNAIPNVHIPETSIDRRPSIDLAVFRERSNLKAFLQVLDWAVDEILRIPSGGV